MKKTGLHNIGLHILALIAISTAAIPLQESLLLYLPFKNDSWPMVMSVLTIAVSYFRPFLPSWVRWGAIICVGLSFSQFSDKAEISLAWGSMLICLFSFTVAVRRIVIQYTGNNRVANKSALRELYNILDQFYLEAAENMNKHFPHAGAKELVPVAHASASMAFSLLLLYIYTLGNHQQIAEWGFYLYIGYMVLVSILYAIATTPSLREFPNRLLSAIVMAMAGIVIMVICIVVVVIAIATIVAVINAISNLLHKLFGRSNK